MFKGAIVALIDPKDRILLLLRPKSAWWAPETWGFPGGKIDPGETPLEAAIRETREETTLVVHDLHELKLELDKSIKVYYTRDYVGSVVIDYEHDDWGWFSRAELASLPTAPNVVEIYNGVINK